MAAVVITPADVALIRSDNQLTAPCGVDVLAGQMVTRHLTTGLWILASTSVQSGKVEGMAIRSAKNGEGLTILKKGLISLGQALSALNFQAELYLSTAGGIDTTAGTPSVIIGIIRAAFGSRPADHILEIDL